MNIFNFIKTKIQILDIISEYTSLKKAGNYYKGQCPFHNEKTASFTVSPHKEIFYCFGCHAGGDVITFVSKIENCSQIEAAKHLAKTYNIQLPTELGKEIPSQPHEKEKYFILCQEVANWCHNQLMITPIALAYLQKRGFNINIIKMFNLGYFPQNYHSIKSLITHLNKFSFIQSDLIDAKIIFEGSKATFSPFEDRIIFPIKDIIGRYCGFGGRIFKEIDQRPKYYNSHENLYFAKGSLLFGFDLAKKSLGKLDHIFMVEGYTDCIAMTQNGHPNTVATLGTACTQEHLKTLSRYVNYIYVLYDGDNAGQNAIMRLTELCWQVSIELKVIKLPAAEDPASFLQNGGNLNSLIEKSQDIFMFFIENICKDFLSKPLSEKLKLANDIIKTISNILDPLKRDILMQKASNIMQIPIDSINSNQNKQFASNKSNNTTYKRQFDTINSSTKDLLIKKNTSTVIDSLKLEKKIFFAIINNIEFMNEENTRILLQYLPEPINGIFTRFSNNIISDNNRNFVSFFETLKEEEKKYISMLLLEFEDKIEQKSFEQLLLQFQKKYWKNIVKNIQESLENAKKEANDKKVAEILERFSQLKQKMLRV